MNEVNKTLYIPLCGKTQISKKGIILHDPMAERIWNEEAFPIKGKAKSNNMLQVQLLRNCEKRI